jgi:4-amino-4-deoxy-L-arabinose transferase-like glycosyltransferase
VPFSADTLRWLIGSTLALNGLVLLFPTVYSDAVVYAVLSKTIAVSGDWVNLTLLGEDWLDKPHLPFWLTALSFTIFGINSFAYLLPGLVFHVLGAAFTYKLAKHFYGIETARVSVLMYLTAVGLLWSTVDLRAEAYLVGEIVAACYCWVRFDEQPRARYLLGGAIFTGMALMTKGLFVIGAIGGGLVIDWLRRKEWRNFARPKWLLAVGASFVCILPELFALYSQFDSHPEKVIYGQTGVSGIRFFFWDSQFGRFFNFGPIQNTNGDPLFFVHTFLWAFLPWTALFIAAAVVALRARKDRPEPERRGAVILWMSFLIPFVLFSLTRFQFDHYIYTVLPFAAILSADYFVRHRLSRWIGQLQIVLAVLLCVLILGLTVYAFRGSSFLWAAAVPGAVLAFFVVARADAPASKALVLPVLAVQSAFLFLVLANWMYFLRYDAGYKLARDLDGRPDIVVYDYRARSLSLAFQARQQYVYIDSLDSVSEDAADCFIVANDADVVDVLNAFPQSHVVSHASGIPTNRLVARMFNNTRWFGDQETTRLSLVQTGSPTREQASWRRGASLPRRARASAPASN